MMPEEGLLLQNKLCHTLLNFEDHLWTGALNIPRPLPDLVRNLLHSISYKPKTVSRMMFAPSLSAHWNQPNTKRY